MADGRWTNYSCKSYSRSVKLWSLTGNCLQAPKFRGDHSVKGGISSVCSRSWQMPKWCPTNLHFSFLKTFYGLQSIWRILSLQWGPWIIMLAYLQNCHYHELHLIYKELCFSKWQSWTAFTNFHGKFTSWNVTNDCLLNRVWTSWLWNLCTCLRIFGGIWTQARLIFDRWL
jgi:hypothetical protein